MASMMRGLRCVGILLVFSGCAVNADVNLQSQNQLIKPTPFVQWRSDAFKLVEVEQVEDVFYLNQERQTHFLDYYHAPANQAVVGHMRLYHYLEDVLSDFSYKGDTYNADLASTELSGNCLSLAILTAAYASLAKLEIDFRQVNTAPIYQRQKGIMTLSSHVQTYVYAPNNEVKSKRNIIFSRSKIIIDYFPSSRSVSGSMLDIADFEAMYYQNLAAKALVDRHFDLAYSLLSVAMELSPNNIETLNTLAVLHNKSGNPAVAEAIYIYAMNHTKGSVNLLSNYITLLEQMGRLAESELLQQQYIDIEDNNPYRWYDLASQAYANERYTVALRYYEKSIQIAPYLHESFFGQAKTYFHLGKRLKAKNAMKKAAELAFKPSDERLYLAKLNLLSQYSRE